MSKLPTTAYDKLGPRQKKFFDVYVQTRTINSIAVEFNVKWYEANEVYCSPNFQKALKEYNANLEKYSVYNQAVIIDKLWLEYNDSATPKNVKVNILVMLGKHIGMWANQTKNQLETKGSVTYNIVNYSNVMEEIDKNKEAVDKEREAVEQNDLPSGIEITSYGETLQ